MYIYGAPRQTFMQFVSAHSIRLPSAFPNQVFHNVLNYTEICSVTTTTLMTNIKLIAVLTFCLHNTIYITVRNSNTPLLISVSLKSRNFLDECHVTILHYTKTTKLDVPQGRTHYTLLDIILRCYLKRHLYFSHLAISLLCHIAINFKRKLIITTLEDPAIA
jgi:hypothetical protein